VYLLSQTIANGWRKTLLAAFAPLLSDGPIILLVLLVLTRTPDWFLSTMQAAGGLFLLYLAWGAYRSFRTAVTLQPLPTEANSQSMVKAALMNGLSPNPYIFWGTIGGPVLIAGWRQSPAHGASFMVGFYGTLIGGFMAFIALFAVAKNLDPRVSRGLSLASALALLFFGLYQLWQGARMPFPPYATQRIFCRTMMLKRKRPCPHPQPDGYIKNLGEKLGHRDSQSKHREPQRKREVFMGIPVIVAASNSVFHKSTAILSL
jgi:threonine/homoserine/homoserine lactone efflux protein